MVKGNPKVTGDKINRIREILEEQGRTQVWLKDKMGYKSRNTLANICANTSQPSLKDLKKIAEHLNVNIKDLLYDTKDK